MAGMESGLFGTLIALLMRHRLVSLELVARIQVSMFRNLMW